MLLSLLFSDPFLFVLVAVSLIVSLTVHEFAHASVADKLGDPTPRIQGRVTLNPRSHLDPLGTLALLLIGFGWGKPVQFDPYNLRHPRRDAALIALAGPATNLTLAIILAVCIYIFPLAPSLYALVSLVISTNVGLAIFNLVPVHPLDGGKILVGLAPRDIAREWDDLLHRYGPMILLLLILPLNDGRSVISSLISPVIDAILRILL